VLSGLTSGESKVEERDITGLTEDGGPQISRLFVSSSV
jgi:hypothetical protein